ncbi:MAG TPA: NUDIX hydrolase [Candidatus Kapabacteria bacterium]|nr:NUDIX hydrolase [Candidatus Kapabacteria bacterium]
MHSSVGALIIEENKILLGKRSENRSFYPNVWDVFGGHIEAGEGLEKTLIRELKEEIGIEPTKWKYLNAVRIIADETITECHLYVVTNWFGKPSNLQPEEHSAIQWFSLESALRLDLAHPDYPSLFIQCLRRTL